MTLSKPVILDQTGKDIVAAISRIVPTESQIDTIEKEIETIGSRITTLEDLHLSVLDGKVCIEYFK